MLREHIEKLVAYVFGPERMRVVLLLYRIDRTGLERSVGHREGHAEDGHFVDSPTELTCHQIGGKAFCHSAPGPEAELLLVGEEGKSTRLVVDGPYIPTADQLEVLTGDILVLRVKQGAERSSADCVLDTLIGLLGGLEDGVPREAVLLDEQGSVHEHLLYPARFVRGEWRLALEPDGVVRVKQYRMCQVAETVLLALVIGSELDLMVDDEEKLGVEFVFLIFPVESHPDLPTTEIPSGAKAVGVERSNGLLGIGDEGSCSSAVAFGEGIGVVAAALAGGRVVPEQSAGSEVDLGAHSDGHESVLPFVYLSEMTLAKRGRACHRPRN